VVKMGISKETIEGFEKEVRDLKKKEEEYRKYAEYFNRQVREETVSEKRFLKAKGKEEYWRMRQSEYGLRVEKVEGQIALMKINEQRKEYRAKLVDHYGAAKDYLLLLKKALEERDLPRARQTLDVLDSVYIRLGSLEKDDARLVTGYLPLQSLKIRFGRISEEMGLEVSIDAVSGGTSVSAQKRANVATWVGQLTGQIGTLIETLEKRMKEVPK